MIDPRPTRRVLRRKQKFDSVAALWWYQRALFAQPRCPVTGEQTVTVHHAIPQAKLREAGLGEDARWDARLAVALSQKAHDNHHSRRRPLTRSELSEGVWAFSADHGGIFDWYLERTYLGDRSDGVGLGESDG